jgi:hypothetical protein
MPKGLFMGEFKMRRALIAIFAAMIAAPLLLPATPAISSPVASGDPQYTALGRVFPDPHGCNAAGSPFAKGTVCATDFIQYQEMIDGMTYLETLFPKFVEFHQLDQDFACSGKPVGNPDQACAAFKSAGLPVTASADQGEGFTRDRQPLYMTRITDERVSNKKKKYFVFPLSIHGIERAGVEGGTRAAEDLATWAACEAELAPAVVDCGSQDNAGPHPLLEATPDKSIFAGEALKKSVVYFIYPNADGWLRGDRTSGTSFYQRYNGNGVDMNRDWPTQGFTFRPYTPWSEPETRGFGKVLQAVGPHDKKGKPKWAGGIDLHGQLVDRAFSFTLMGASERPYDKNQRILQLVKGAWADAEQRLAWSPLIKPNDAPGQPDDPRLYGVQWGTVWDTIDYTVTGSLGDWIDSPIGLNADGIDNEMSLSHLSNCGVGSCFDQDVEQLHVDGNKSLVYSMINYSLKPEKKVFRTKGKVAYLFNKGVVSGKARKISPNNRFKKYKTQEPIHDELLSIANEHTFEFEIQGPKDKIYNGGVTATLTCNNVQGVGPCALNEARLERKKPAEPNAQGEEWEVVNSYFNQGNTYVQAGQALHGNFPTPGTYRVKVYNNPQGIFDLDIDFTKEQAWEDPGQLAYRATNMNFWKDLRKFTKPKISKLTTKKLLRSKKWQKRFDTVVVTDKAYPKKIAKKLKKWVAKRDGNLVLLDSAMKMLPTMKIVKGKSSVGSGSVYAGYVNFTTGDKEVTYDDPLAKKINQPGAAEGGAPSNDDPSPSGEIHRHQTYEPVPIGYSIQTDNGGDANSSPFYFVAAPAWSAAKGKPRAAGTTQSTANVSLGETVYKGGRIRFIGALLPMPTEKFDHPFGLADYSLTYTGYQLLKNALTYKN